MGYKLFEYGSIWSDNDHRFGHPFRLYEEPPRFPDVHFRAPNLTEAMKFIERLNDRMPGVDREDMNAAKFLEDLL